MDFKNDWYWLLAYYFQDFKSSKMIAKWQWEYRYPVITLTVVIV